MRQYIFTYDEKMVMRAYIREGKKGGKFRQLKRRLNNFANSIWNEVLLWHAFETVLEQRGELNRPKFGTEKREIPKALIKTEETLANLEEAFRFIREHLLPQEFIVTLQVRNELKNFFLLPKEVREAIIDQWGGIPRSF